MKKGYKDNIEVLTQENSDFRHVLYTAGHCQLVLMSLLPGQDIGEEIHADNDQFFRFEKGKGKVVINDTEYAVADGDVIIVPAGAQHNVINVSTTEKLRLYTIYAPPHHKDGVERVSKSAAEGDSPEFDGNISEAFLQSKSEV
jgi:mannose-6-phosphate isomerase-like protein (cupin superfamily)